MNPNHKVWINEIHYRNEGDDVPFIELIGPANSPGDGYEVVLFQGRNGAMMKKSHSLLGKTFREGKTGNGWGFLTLSDADIKSNEIRKGKEGKLCG